MREATFRSTVSRTNAMMAGVLRAGPARCAPLLLFTTIVCAQNAPAPADAPVEKPSTAVPAPPAPAGTLPESKPARPANPAPTGSPSAAAPGTPATSSGGAATPPPAMRSLRAPASNFITAPAPVLPAGAAPTAVNGSAPPGPSASAPAPILPPAAAGISDASPAQPGGGKPATADSVAPPAAPPSADAKKPGTATTATAAVAGALAAPLSLNALKRLSREEIQSTTSDSFSMYVLRDNERTLVLDFPNIREQGRMFARLILFIERAGTPKTRVMTVSEVQKWLAQNAASIDSLTVGNNMKTGELARFFNSARFQGEPITVHEQRLYEALVQLQLLREEDAGVAVVDPERILVSVPQASSVSGCASCTVSPAARAVILQHELSHARFATDTVYQNYAIWFWANVMSLAQRDKFQRFLRTRGYDSTIGELCANETQAFLMHTPDPRMFAAADVGMTDAELAELRQRFQEGLAPRPRSAVDKAYQFE